jgi:hypothetical protein
MMMPEAYAWISWLGERDAQVLLISLMARIEQESPPETLKQMVEGWRSNAQKALTADDYHAYIDRFLEVFAAPHPAVSPGVGNHPQAGLADRPGPPPSPARTSSVRVTPTLRQHIHDAAMAVGVPVSR